MVLNKHSMKQLRAMAREYRKRCPKEKVRNRELYAILSRCDEATFNAITSKQMTCDGSFARPLVDFIHKLKSGWTPRVFPGRTFIKAFFVYGKDAGDISLEIAADGGISWKLVDKRVDGQNEALKGKSPPSSQSLH